MLSFTKENKTLTINEVDKIATDFWIKEIYPRFSTRPKNTLSLNWFAVLGRAIEGLQYGKSDYYETPLYRSSNVGNIRFDMATIAAFIASSNFKHANSTQVFCETGVQPYIELCDYLKSLGIEVVCID